MASPETSPRNGFRSKPQQKKKKKPDMASSETSPRNGFRSEAQQKKKKKPDMVSLETSQENRSTFEPQGKKRKIVSNHGDKESNITKDTLLKDLQDIEEDIGKLNHGSLRKKLEPLRRQVEKLLENQKKQIEWLNEEIRVFKRRIEMVKAENEKLRNEKESLNKKLVLGQATWVWEANLVRFVIYSTQQIYSFDRFNQMIDFLKKAKTNIWRKIQVVLGEWDETHWEMVKKVREERNARAHPSVVDLDLVEDEIPNMPPKFREKMKHMLNITKMTSSLMKFGRLVSSYKDSGQPPLKLEGGQKKALEEIISWDRNFEDIGSLQNIGHEEAKAYLQKFVGDDHSIEDYFSIVDDVKKGNSKRLGKMAKEFAERFIVHEMSKEKKEALNGLKKLFRAGERNVTVLDSTIAKLHIPDFLPKDLWKHGLEIVDEY